MKKHDWIIIIGILNFYKIFAQGHYEVQLNKINVDVYHGFYQESNNELTHLIKLFDHKKKPQTLLLKSKVSIELNRFQEADSLLENTLIKYGNNKLVRIKALNLQLYSSILQENYQEAELLSKKISTYKRILNKSPLVDAAYLEFSGLLKIEQELYEEAKRYYNQALAIRNKQPKKHLFIGRLYARLARVAIEQSQYEIAENYLIRADTILSKLVIRHPDFGYVKDYQGWLNIRQSQYSKAKINLEQAITIRENKLGKNSLKLGESYINIGAAYHKIGNYELAETYFLQAKEIFEITNPNKPLLSTALQHLGGVANTLANYENALPLLEQSVKILKESPKFNAYAYSMNSLAVVYKILNQGEKSEKIYLETKELLEAKRGKLNEIYPIIILNLGEYYDFNDKPEKALPLYEEAATIFKQLYGEKNSNYAATLNNLAYLYESIDDYEKAEFSYLKMEKIDKEVLGITHPDYLYTLYNIAKLYRKTNNSEKAIHYFQKANKGQLDLIHNYYSGFDEATRILYLKEVQIGFNELYSYLSDGHQDARLLEDAQQVSLVTKGLALDYNRWNSATALNQQDELTNTLYKEWQAYRKKLSKAYSLSQQERVANEIDLAQLQEDTELAEKQLVRQAKQLATVLPIQNTVCPADIRQKLNTQEVAIDFIKFKYYPTDAELSDTILYCALLTQKDQPSPKFIRLCKEANLQKMLTLSAQYGAGYAKYPEIGTELYRLIWQPLEAHLKDIKTIHLSPTGLLHKVAFGALPKKGQPLLSQYELNYYGNLRDFVQIKPSLPFKSISLLGGAIFDIDSTELVQLSQQNPTVMPGNTEDKVSITNTYSVSRAIASDSTRNAVEFNYLPGTKQEVENIAQQFKHKNWQVQMYIGKQALEDKVKALEGDKAPSILHLATHGFFFNPYDKTNQTATDETLRERIIMADSPLLRSGLVFSGVNHTWKGGQTIGKLEDGVLTAYEIANLNLWNTQLVVLSACETGLGDTQSAEGVFGLQRSFKAAGVNQLLLSLWKIPDAQTAELMQLFYQYFLAGDTPKDALRKAQLEMSKQYDAFYWAGFILIN